MKFLPQNHAQYGSKMKTLGINLNILWSITIMQKNWKVRKSSSQDMTKTVKIWHFCYFSHILRTQNNAPYGLKLKTIGIDVNILQSVTIMWKTKKFSSTVLKIWLTWWKSELLVLRHLQIGVFKILPNVSFWRPELLLKSSRK